MSSPAKKQLGKHRICQAIPARYTQDGCLRKHRTEANSATDPESGFEAPHPASHTIESDQTRSTTAQRIAATSVPGGSAESRTGGANDDRSERSQGAAERCRRVCEERLATRVELTKRPCDAPPPCCAATARLGGECGSRARHAGPRRPRHQILGRGNGEAGRRARRRLPGAARGGRVHAPRAWMPAALRAGLAGCREQPSRRGALRQRVAAASSPRTANPNNASDRSRSRGTRVRARRRRRLGDQLRGRGPEERGSAGNADGRVAGWRRPGDQTLQP